MQYYSLSIKACFLSLVHPRLGIVLLWLHLRPFPGYLLTIAGYRCVLTIWSSLPVSYPFALLHTIHGVPPRQEL